jgi:hypothetical protein
VSPPAISFLAYQSPANPFAFAVPSANEIGHSLSISFFDGTHYSHVWLNTQVSIYIYVYILLWLFTFLAIDIYVIFAIITLRSPLLLTSGKYFSKIGSSFCFQVRQNKQIICDEANKINDVISKVRAFSR